MLWIMILIGIGVVLMLLGGATAADCGPLADYYDIDSGKTGMILFFTGLIIIPIGGILVLTLY